MAYVKNTWVDQKVQRPKTYNFTTNDDGSTTLIDAFGNVEELGTPVNADNMNHIEDGLANVGIWTYSATVEYNKDDAVIGIVDNEFVLYKSKQDKNKGNDLSDTDYWEKVNLGGGGGLEVCDIGMSLFVDETKGLRRRLNGQIVNINANTQGFLTRLKRITTLHPSLLTDEATWQSDKTLSAYGQVGRFVFNYASDGVTVESVRLPAVVNVQGLMDLANTGFTVPAGLPTLYTNSTGAHYHDRGDMNITGAVYNNHYGDNNGSLTADATGAFSRSNLKPSMTVSGTATRIYGADYYFNAANSWTGVTSTNGEHSHYIAGTSSTIQPEAIQYPYFIQIATGQETENNIVNDIELNNPFVLFKSQYTETPLYNLSWLESDGEYQPKATYIKPYEALIVEQNTGVEVGTTVDLPSGTKYTKRGLSVKLSTATDITDYDFVINIADEMFRLPLKNHSADDGNANLILYYYVGETVQNVNLINAGRLGEELVDLKTQVAAKANMTDVWTLSTVGNALIPMSWGASGSKYIAPSNGKFFLEVSSGNSNEYIRLYWTKNGVSRVGIGNVAFVSVVDISVDAGDEVVLFHNISKEPTKFVFIKANGD